MADNNTLADAVADYLREMSKSSGPQVAEIQADILRIGDAIAKQAAENEERAARVRETMANGSRLTKHRFTL